LFAYNQHGKTPVISEFNDFLVEAVSQALLIR
jgi:hypothetical protein